MTINKRNIKHILLFYNGLQSPKEPDNPLGYKNPWSPCGVHSTCALERRPLIRPGKILNIT